MNLHSVFEELDKLYESVEEPVEEPVEEEAVEPEVKEALKESADDDEIVIEEEPVAEDQPEAEEVEVDEIQLVLECSKCGGLKVVTEADVKVDEETDLANVGDACQYCEEADGYKIIGSLTPYAAAEEVAEEEPVEEVEDEAAEEVVEEGLLDVDLPISVDVKADGNNVTVGGIS